VVAQTETSIWQGVVSHSLKRLTPSEAKIVLKLKFRKSDIDRMNELSALAQEGRLNSDQKQEIELYNRIGIAMEIMQSQARQILAKPRRR
jgi:predicted nucleotidyltransferase